VETQERRRAFKLRSDGIFVRLPHDRTQLLEWKGLLPFLLLVLVVVVTLITDSATRSHLHLQSVRLASSNQAARQFVWDVSQSTAAADVERVLGPTTNALDTALDTVHLFADKTSLEEALLRKKLSLDSLAPPWSDAKTTFKAFFRSAREPFLECDASIRGY